MNRQELIRILGTAALLTSATAAQAHPGHGLAGGLAGGFVHPFTGLDHLLALLAVGLWAAQQGGRAAWGLPAAFLATMAAGFALALAGVSLPAVEPVAAASVLVLGLAVGSAVRAPLAGALLVGAFGLWHGYAHGGELAAGAAGPALAGMLAASATVQALGWLGGSLMKRGRLPLLRAGGMAIGALGALLLAGV